MRNARFFGYAREFESKNRIDEHGIDAERVLRLMRESYPSFNPYAEPTNELKWQGRQGACQGHSLAQAAQIMAMQAYSCQQLFSRGGCYYESQRHDRINGDRGSTLAAGQKVARDGIVLESDWAYPVQYDPKRPSNFENLPRIYLNSSKTVKDADLIFDLLKAGAVIQTGVSWNQSFEKPVSDRYSTMGGGGGHSTLLYQLDEATGNAIHHNSWRAWMNDGRSQWTKDFVKSILRHDRWAVFIAYQSSEIRVDPGIVPENPGFVPERKVEEYETDY